MFDHLVGLALFLLLPSYYAIKNFQSKVDDDFVFTDTLSNVNNNKDLMQQTKDVSVDEVGKPYLKKF